MAITFGFFDSVDEDRKYDADQMSTYFEGLISDGVYENIGDRFAVTASGVGLGLSIGTGRAIIKSHWIKSDALETLTLDPADVQFTRIDAVVLRYDAAAREITLTLKKGTPAPSAQIPEITRNDEVYELYLAAVYLNKGATSPSMISDLRGSTYCSWVTGIVKQVDTSDLFRQWQTAYAEYYAESTAAFDAYMTSRMAAFNAWFSALTKELTVQTGVTKLYYQYKGRGPLSFVVFGVQFDGRNPIPFNDYNPETDILLLYFDGKYVEQDFDYLIKKYDLPVIFGERGTCWYYVEFIQPFSEAQLSFVLLRNVIGPNVTPEPFAVSDVLPVSNGGVSDDIIAIAEEE